MKATIVIGGLAALSCFLVPAAWSAVGGGEFELPWHTIDGGGVMHSTGGGFTLSSTIGQPDAGRLSGGGWVLTGGFWFEIVPGDVNNDGAINVADLVGLAPCLDGPGPATAPECEQFDLNADGRVDLEDFARFQRNVDGA